MRLRRVAAIVRRHVWETLQNPDRIADSLFWPFVDVMTWGFFSRYLVHGGYAAPETLIGGIVLWGAFRSFQRDMAVGFLSEIWSRNISGLFASPLDVGDYLVGLAIVNLAKVLLALGLIALACHVFTGAPRAELVLRLLTPLAVLLISGAAIGLFVTALILRFSTRLQTLAYGLAGLLMPISCVFYPLSALPAWLRPIAGILPTTQAFEQMRKSMHGEGSAADAFASGGAGAILAIVAALIFFHLIFAAVRRSGRLVRPE
jgi:ABC-2 type transport system permease protein